MGELMTLQEVAKRLRFTTDSVRTGPLRTALPWLILNGRLRLPAEALEAHIAAGREAHTGPRTIVRRPHER